MGRRSIGNYEAAGIHGLLQTVIIIIGLVLAPVMGGVLWSAAGSWEACVQLDHGDRVSVLDRIRELRLAMRAHAAAVLGELRCRRRQGGGRRRRPDGGDAERGWATSAACGHQRNGEDTHESRYAAPKRQATRPSPQSISVVTVAGGAVHVVAPSEVRVRELPSRPVYNIWDNRGLTTVKSLLSGVADNECQMNGVDAPHQGGRPHLWPAGCTTLALVAIAFLAAACGGGSASPGVASLGSTTTTTTPASAAQSTSKATNYVDAVAYAQCMRTHGVPNMPDPDSNGNFLFKGGVLNGVRGIDPNSSQYQKADKACRHLLPNGGQSTPAELAQAIAQALKFVACLRKHGLPNMPDPVVSGGGIMLHGPPGAGPNSPQFQAAQKACQSFMLGGGP